MNLLAALARCAGTLTGCGVNHEGEPFAHAWGLPGGDFAARSRCTFHFEKS